MTDPSCFRNDETNTNVFIHVDDGLLFGPRSEVSKLEELLSKQVLLGIVGRMENLGDKNFIPGQSDRANDTRILGGSESEVHPRRDHSSKFGRSKTRDDCEYEEDANDRNHSLSRRTKDEQCTETVVGKLLYMCQERADIMYSVRETARKITCLTESDEMNLKRIVRDLKGVPSAEYLTEIVAPPKFVNVYTDSDWAGQATTCKKGQAAELCSGGNATLTAWSRDTANSEPEFC